MSKRFTTVNDLRNWVDNAMGADATPETVTAVTTWIQWDPNRPEWGLADWTDYLGTLDLWYIADGLGL